MLLFVAVVLVLTSLLYVVYRQTVKPKDFPPGPGWRPFTGCLGEVKSLSRTLGGSHVAYLALSKRYASPVIGLKLGRMLTVCVCSDAHVKEILRGDACVDRPLTFFSALRSWGTHKGITFTNGEHWRTQRNFVLRHMRNLGLGKSKMDALVSEECAKVVRTLAATQQSHHIGMLIAPCILNILWTIVAGDRIDRDNKHLPNLLALMEQRSKMFDLSAGWMNSWPWMRFLVPNALGYNLIVALNQALKAMFTSVIKEHYQTWVPGKMDDLIYTFLSEMHETNDASFTDEQLVMVCADLFIGGSQTTSNTLDFAFMCMILYPDVQKRVHDALDAAFPNGLSPTYKQRHLLPYLEAVIAEVHRCYSVAPITGPRRAAADIKLGAYVIPQGTTLLFNNYAVFHDPTIWENPSAFQPTRFLDANGDFVVSDYLYPFNIGKRKCPADTLARNCIFTFFAQIMKSYEVSLDAHSAPLTGVPLPGITLSPENYKACFTKRSNSSS